MPPEIGLVTVRLASVPTEVSEELTIFAGSAVPVSPEAAAPIVMFAVPSKASPLIVLAVASLVAVAALPSTLPAIVPVTDKPVNVPTEVIAGCAGAVTVAAVPVIFPVIGAVTDKPVNVPTEVIAGWAAAVTVPAVVALVAEVALVAVAALPVILPAIGLVTVKLARVPTEVSEELTIVDFKVVPVNVLASGVAAAVISASSSVKAA